MGPVTQEVTSSRSTVLYLGRCKDRRWFYYCKFEKPGHKLREVVDRRRVVWSEERVEYSFGVRSDKQGDTEE